MKRTEINKKPNVGDKVFVVEGGDLARYNKNNNLPSNSYYLEVEKVGNKYFYIKTNWNQIVKVRIDGWKEDSNYSSNFMFFENEEQYSKVQRWDFLNSEIHKYFDHYRRNPVTLDQLEEIAKILEIEKELLV